MEHYQKTYNATVISYNDDGTEVSTIEKQYLPHLKNGLL